MNTKSNRAGRYITQPTGYSAFIPEPLPPGNPEIEIGQDLQVLLSKADRALGRLDGSIQTLPNSELFVYMYVRKEAVLSSQIEGTQSSLQDLIAAEAKIHSRSSSSDVDEVINYVGAMNYGLDRINTIPISVRLIREIHAELLKGVRGSHLTPGELRTSQNWIGPSGCTLSEAIYVPPPQHEIQNLLGDLEIFLHSDSGLPLLIKIGLAHAHFETIHPFLDGNGRVGRLLITFLLCAQGVILKPVLYLSYYFKQHRQQYYEELQSIRDAGTWEQWLNFFLHGVIEVSKQATEDARQVLLLRESDRTKITDNLGRSAANAHRVLESLYERPIVSATDVVELTGTSAPAAYNLVNKLVELDILHEFTGQSRHRRFIYQHYVNLFRD